MGNNTDYVQLYLSEMARHEAALTLLVTVVIGVVALIFTIGAFLVWRENKAVVHAADSHLTALADKRREIDAWYDEKRLSLDAYLKAEFDKFNQQVDEIRCYQALLVALDKPDLDGAIIFPALCVLAERPCQLYVGVFRQVVERNVNQEVTERAQLGLAKWKEMQKHGVKAHKVQC